MSDYPTPSEYQEAVQFPDTAFADEELQQAHPDETMLGLPKAITGNFAAVFPMTASTGQRWAVKCFLTDTSDQQARYQAISEHLETHDTPYMVDFVYQPRGIQVDGAWYPVLKMEWAQGMPINRFVEEQLDRPDAIEQVATAWAAMLDTLEEKSIAHGDLQHGNVLVEERPGGIDLTLVDYDTMYVPALQGRTSAEVGHRNYQHPDRTEDDFGPHLDRFAGLVIYTALQACIHRADLWERYDTGENMLFRAADFYDPESSTLFQDLGEIETLESVVESLQRACYVEFTSVPPLSEAREGETGTAWYDSVRSAAVRRRRADEERDPFARWFLPATAGGVVTATLLAGLGYPAIGLLALGVGFGGGGWATWSHYQRLSIVRRHRRLDQEIAHIDDMIASLERQIDALKEKRSKVQSSVSERREERLEEIREEALYDQLKYHFIGEARGVEGITHKIVVRLKAAGIRTAYGATPEQLGEVSGISSEHRTRLTMWRSSLVAQYEDEIPGQLSPAEERRIDRYVQRRMDEIDSEIARAREKIRVQQEERRRIEERRDEMPSLSLGRYIRYLLYADTLPRMETAPTPSHDGSPDDREPVAPIPSTDQTQDDTPWWEQRA